jgi:hypothetical protein
LNNSITEEKKFAHSMMWRPKHQDDWVIVDVDEEPTAPSEHLATRILASPLVVSACLGVAQHACSATHADWRLQMALALAVWIARSRHRPAGFFRIGPGKA